MWITLDFHLDLLCVCAKRTEDDRQRERTVFGDARAQATSLPKDDDDDDDEGDGRREGRSVEGYFFLLL